MSRDREFRLSVCAGSPVELKVFIPLSVVWSSYENALQNFVARFVEYWGFYVLEVGKNLR